MRLVISGGWPTLSAGGRCVWMVYGAGWECCDSVGGWECSRKVSCNLQDCECSQQNKSGEQLELWLWGLSGHIVTRGAFDV